MANFHKYLHVYRLNTSDVDGILNGKCFIQPKLDGTNSSIWFDTDLNSICAGSRNRVLSEDKDNAGFYNWVINSDNDEIVYLREFVLNNPRYIICGEWLGLNSFVGSIKDYNPDALGYLWIFDIYDNELNRYIDYDNVIDIAKKNGFEKYVIPCLKVIDNPKEEDLVNIANKNKFMLNNTDHSGEGIVIKNYNFKNRYGHFEVAKIVLDEYKQNQSKSKKININKGDIENIISDLYCTDSEMSKNKSKVAILCNIDEFDNTSSKCVGMFLNFCFYDSVLSEAPNWVKKFKNPTINFKTLQNIIFAKARSYIGL